MKGKGSGALTPEPQAGTSGVNQGRQSALEFCNRWRGRNYGTVFTPLYSLGFMHIIDRSASRELSNHWPCHLLNTRWKNKGRFRDNGCPSVSVNLNSGSLQPMSRLSTRCPSISVIIVKKLGKVMGRNQITDVACAPGGTLPLFLSNNIRCPYLAGSNETRTT